MVGPALMSIQSHLQALPKAELHIHLEGAIPPETLLELAQRKNEKLPAETLEELTEWFKFRDFNHFLEMFAHIYKCVLDADDFELITYSLAKKLSDQNVRYAEVSVSPSAHYSRGIDHAVYLEGLRKGRARALSELGVTINWIFEISRHRDIAMADYTTEIAIDSCIDGVVALGLAGQEQGNPAENYASFFDRAKAAGLRSAPHAGELVGPESVWGALKCLHADRIAHGVRAIEDPSLVRHLAEQQIPLAVCPSSNICLGVYPNLGAHPLLALLAQEVPLSVNTDDPTLFNTTLNREFELLHKEMGLDISSIEILVSNAFKHSFLPAEQKQELLRSFREAKLLQ